MLGNHYRTTGRKFLRVAMALPKTLPQMSMFNSRTFASYQPALHKDRLNAHVLEAEYAVRGKLVIMAGELEKRLKQPDHGLPFDSVTYCNIGNPQSVGQPPLSFPRQVMALVTNPALLEEKNMHLTSQLYPADVIARATTLVRSAGSIGAYSHSKGVEECRNSVVRYIEERDGFPADPENIFLTNGASEGIKAVMQMLIRDSNDGVLIPIPQYPLYSATAALLGAAVIPYQLDESKAWGIDFDSLRASLAEAKARGVTPRGMVVINPGNPTGQVLSTENMSETIKLCLEENLVLFADEVYQANVYGDKPFRSFKKTLRELGPEYDACELLSFHSTSKGFLGECGFRGGYMECVGILPDVMEQIYKLMSINLCSNVSGQMMTEMMVNPPKEGEPSYPVYQQERDAIMDSLKRKAKKCAEVFNTLEGMSCNHAEGAMYLFPRIQLPAGAIAAAEKEGAVPDAFYCVKLLESTGICVVPGSGFGQAEGTWHFRTTFLPDEAAIDKMLTLMATFHNDFMKQYS